MTCRINNDPCPACGTRRFLPQVMARGTRIYRCTSCGLSTWDWQAFDFVSFYDASYWRSSEVGKGYADYFSLADAMTFTHKKRLRWIMSHLHAAGCQAPAPATSAGVSTVGRPRLLDAGCGPGFFVQAAANAGFEASGTEISEFAVTFAREQLGQNVWQGQVRHGDLGDGPYDVVTMWDVIEHLPDPVDALTAIGRVMPKGALLVLSTGDISTPAARLSGARWHLFNLPEHLWFFSRESLKRLLRRAGFELVECGYEVCWYPVRYLVERLEAMTGSTRWLSSRLGAAGGIRVPVTLGDVVTIIARRGGTPGTLTD